VEGNTEELNFFDNGTELILKREDKNPTGSWKDRGTAVKVAELLQNNVYEAAISTSGNAAISFLTYLNSQNKDFVLHVCVLDTINPKKLEKINELIKGTNHKLHISDNPLKQSVEIAASNKCVNLRASIDETIVKGYWHLGYELKKFLLPDRKIGLFAPVSSGTALVGIVQGMQQKLQHDWLLPQVYACQTTSTHPIVTELESGNVEFITHSEEISLADAIIDKTALRAPQIVKIIKETSGNALAIENFELEEAKLFIQDKQGIELSYTSLLSVAGYLRTKQQNVKLDRAILIASGT